MQRDPIGARRQGVTKEVGPAAVGGALGTDVLFMAFETLPI